jgi:hypothetical protein
MRECKRWSMNAEAAFQRHRRSSHGRGCPTRRGLRRVGAPDFNPFPRVSHKSSARSVNGDVRVPPSGFSDFQQLGETHKFIPYRGRAALQRRVNPPDSVRASAPGVPPSKQSQLRLPHSSRFSTSGCHGFQSLLRVSHKSNAGICPRHPRNPEQSGSENSRLTPRVLRS